MWIALKVILSSALFSSPPTEPLRPAGERLTSVPHAEEWVEKRRGLENVTQMHFARKGVVTEEMALRRRAREARRPSSSAARSRAGGMIIPANVNHANLEPMGIGIAALVQGQREHRQQRRSRATSTSELREARHLAQVRRRHGDGPLDRRRHRRHPPRASSRPRRCRSAPCRSTRRSRSAKDVKQAHRRRHDRHARAPGEAGRRLLHDPRRRARRVPAAREGPHHRHRLARRLDHGRSG